MLKNRTSQKYIFFYKKQMSFDTFQMRLTFKVLKVLYKFSNAILNMIVLTYTSQLPLVYSWFLMSSLLSPLFLSLLLLSQSSWTMAMEVHRLAIIHDPDFCGHGGWERTGRERDTSRGGHINRLLINYWI